MKKAICTVLVLFISIAVQADERLYRKLDRKFSKDPAKGLAFARKLKSNRSTEPDAYYFLSKMYLEKHLSEKRLVKQYSAINRAATEAYRTKKYTTNHPYLKAKQDVLFAAISSNLVDFRDTFLKHKDYDKSERIAMQYNRLTGLHLPTLAQLDSVEQEKQKKARLLLQVARQVEGKYYGMPLGDEDIEPYDFAGEKEFLKLLNNARKSKGLDALKWDFNLTRAARYHANDMATQRYFDHNTYDRIDGKLVKIGGTFTRIRKFYNLRFVNSENIAAGSKLAKDTYYQWYISKGHHENMFNKKSKYIGIGVAYNPDSPYKYYWVMCTAR
jgi:uncharacterized protein YkwD